MVTFRGVYCVTWVDEHDFNIGVDFDWVSIGQGLLKSISN